jgi:flagellar hook-associated protein FlgK
MFKEETPMILPENATAINRKGEVIATGKAKEEKPPVSYQEYQLAKKEGFTGSYNDYQTLDANRKAPKINVGVGGGEVSGGGTNNNGIPVGKFDKMGRYISPKGEVYPASAVTEARKEHDAATDLAFKLNQLSESDIKNAYGSLTDYTTSRVGRMAGSTKTVDAQTKINNLQINSVLNNLSQLKGASSDKEMAQMIKDFPGYEAPPSVMNNWVNRAATATNRFLKRSENRFGFDTEYANPSIKSTTKDDAGDFTIRRKQ